MIHLDFLILLTSFSDLVNITPQRAVQIFNNIPNPLSLFLAIPAGAIAGFLINYLADVLPVSRNLTRPECPNCHQPYTFKDYLFSRHCPNCGNKKSPRSLIALVFSILCCVLLRLFPFANLGFWASLPLFAFLGVILVIDIEHRLVLTETSLAGIALCLLYGILIRGLGKTLLGALAGLSIMLIFYLLGIGFSKLMGKLRGKKVSEVAFGFGDVMAGTFLGLLAGWPGIAGGILIAIFAFGAFSLIFLVGLFLSKRYQAFASAQPFTPFLILGVIIIYYL